MLHCELVIPPYLCTYNALSNEWSGIHCSPPCRKEVVACLCPADVQSGSEQPPPLIFGQKRTRRGIQRMGSRVLKNNAEGSVVVRTRKQKGINCKEAEEGQVDGRVMKGSWKWMGLLSRLASHAF